MTSRFIDEALVARKPALAILWMGEPDATQHTRPLGSPEHLAVLRQARLVTEEPRGRRRYYHLAAEPLADVQDWLHPFERYWRARLTALRDFVEGDIHEQD